MTKKKAQPALPAYKVMTHAELEKDYEAAIATLERAAKRVVELETENKALAAERDAVHGRLERLRDSIIGSVLNGISKG